MAAAGAVAMVGVAMAAAPAVAVMVAMWAADRVVGAPAPLE